MGKKLYVGNLHYKVTQEEITKLFGEIGQCLSVKIIYDKFSGESKGFAFVEMGTDEEAQEAIKKLNGSQIYGRGIMVNEAREQAPRSRGPRRKPGGGGGGFRSRGRF